MGTLQQLVKKKRKKKNFFKGQKGIRSRPQLKGVCLKVFTRAPKKPNSAVRKVAKLKLSTGVVVIGYIPGEGHSLQEHSTVLVRGGRTKDLPIKPTSRTKPKRLNWITR